MIDIDNIWDVPVDRLKVEGFKSIGKECTVDIRPLTILAGANSSGKSSIIQPLLLMKQTLESPLDSGPLMLEGPNARFTSAKQILSKHIRAENIDSFSVSLRNLDRTECKTVFKASKRHGFRIEEQTYTDSRKNTINIRQNMSAKNIMSQTINPPKPTDQIGATVSRNRCFLYPEFYSTAKLEDLPGQTQMEIFTKIYEMSSRFRSENPFGYRSFMQNIQSIIHLPSIRGSPSRTYPATARAMPKGFPGTFENYVPTIIMNWKQSRSRTPTPLPELRKDLIRLQLARSVTTQRVEDTRTKLVISTLKRKTGKSYQINIADVGFGISQVLPILVALHVARPNQIVYIEQPEAHLHPAAQWRMAEVMAKAAKRGVRLIIETHSALLILGIQALVAKYNPDEDKALSNPNISNNLVKLHWFSLGSDGNTQVSSADLDEKGAFGEWPEDFGNIELMAQKDYMDAVDVRMLGIDE